MVMRRRWLGVALLGSIAGCGQLPTYVPIGSSALTRSPAQTSSDTLWIINNPVDEDGFSAGILDPTRSFRIDALCSARFPHFSIVLTALRRPADLDNPTLDLAFDDGEPAPSALLSAIDAERWSFAASTDVPGFWDLTDDLRRHKSVEAIFRQSERERRFRFTLSGAEAAIDYVDKKCTALGPS